MSLEVSDLLSASQLRDQVCFGIASPGDVVHFETFEIVNESLHDVIVLEQHYFSGLVSVGNLSLDKLQVCVAS